MSYQACLSPLFYANIVHVVKKCYKIKIDYRDLKRRFCSVLNCSLPHFQSFKPFLPSNCSPFEEQKDNYCIAKKPLMEGKSTPFEVIWSIFTLQKLVTQCCYQCNCLYINSINKTAQNLRFQHQIFPRAFSSQF